MSRYLGTLAQACLLVSLLVCLLGLQGAVLTRSVAAQAQQGWGMQGDMSSEGATEAGDDGDLFADEPGDEEEEETWHDNLPLRVQLIAGFGVAVHASEVPATLGIDRVLEAVVPAMQIGAAAEGKPGEGVAGGVRVQYRTSLGYELTRTADRQVAQTTPARKQHLAVEGMFRFDFSGQEDGLSVPIFVGMSITDFSTDVPLNVLEYGWLGLHVRPSLRMTLAKGGFRLTLGPSLGGIVYAAKGLERLGIARMGLLLGGEAELQVRVFEHVFVQFSYLEQRGQLAEENGSRTLIDTQRAATGGVVVAY